MLVFLCTLMLFGYANCGAFEDQPELSVQTVLETFNQAALEKYRNAIPNLSLNMASEVNNLLDEIYSATENKRMVNQTKLRFDLFLNQTRTAVDNALSFIEIGLNDIKKASIQSTNQIFESAKSLEVELIKRNCSDAEVTDLLKPYINQTVECIRNAAKIEENFEQNANIASKSLENIMESVILSLKICKNKGQRSSICAQRSAFLLTRRLEEFRFVTDRQFSRAEVDIVRLSLQKGKSCALDTIANGQVHLKNASCINTINNTTKKSGLRSTTNNVADENDYEERKFDVVFEKQIFDILSNDYN